MTLSPSDTSGADGSAVHPGSVAAAGAPAAAPGGPHRVPLATAAKVRAAVAAVLMAVGIVWSVEAVQLGLGTLRQPGPGLFPLLVGGLLLCSALALLVASLRGRITDASDAVSAEDHPEGDAQESGARRAGPRARLVTVLGALAAYVVGVGWVGHLVTSTVVCAVTLRVAGGRAWWWCLLVGAAAGVGSHLLFVELLAVPLPTGLYGPRL